MTACEYRKTEIVKYILNDLGDVVSAMAPTLSSTEAIAEDHLRGRTALHIAAAHNTVDILDMLIKKCPLAIQDEHVRCVLESERECVCVCERKKRKKERIYYAGRDCASLCTKKFEH